MAGKRTFKLKADKHGSIYVVFSDKLVRFTTSTLDEMLLFKDRFAKLKEDDKMLVSFPEKEEEPQK